MFCFFVSVVFVAVVSFLFCIGVVLGFEAFLRASAYDMFLFALMLLAEAATWNFGHSLAPVL